MLLIASQGNVHIEDVGADHPPYNSDPPTSGWHTPQLASWGEYDYVVPDETLLHNMEDGGVIIYYPLGTVEQNAEQLDKLGEVARGYRRVVVAPRDGLTGYVMTAWQRSQAFDTLDEAGMRAFLEAFEGIDHH